MNKIKVLFLAANPKDTQPLQLGEELRAITQKIRASEYRASLDLVSAWAVRPDDLLQVLNENKPHLVHFSGHGSPLGELILVDQNGVSKPVTSKAIKALFTTLRDNIKVVIFNACYSKIQARAITTVIDCAVGMSNTIGDTAAIIFAASFYRAIGFGRSIQDAFDQGKVALMLEGFEGEIVKLWIKKGADPSQIFLIDASSELSNDKVDDLIELLNFRAEKTISDLSKYFKYAQVQSYIDKFKCLHTQHIEALKKEDLIYAYEISREIHKLSYELESDECFSFRRIETPHISYCPPSPSEFARGKLISTYIGESGQKYLPNLPGSKYISSQIKFPQNAAIWLYREILSDSK